MWDHSAVKRRRSAFLAILASALQEGGKEGRRNRGNWGELNSSGAGRGQGRLPLRCSDGRCMQVLGVLFSLLLQEAVEGGTTAGEGRAWEGCRESVCL